MSNEFKDVALIPGIAGRDLNWIPDPIWLDASSTWPVNSPHPDAIHHELEDNSVTYKTKLPNIVYYNDDHSKSPACTDEISIRMGATWTLPCTWQELIREIENGAYKIIFHIDMITKSKKCVTDFINSLNTVVSFMPGHKPLRILVLITPTTTQQQVKELKDSGILGIGPDLNYYSVEQASESAKALIAGEPYWPEDIISQLPVEIDKPLIVYFRSDWELLLPQDAVTKIQKLPDVDVKFISSWDELAPAIKLEPDQLIFHADVAQKSGHSVDEVITMVKTTVGLILPEKDVPICIGIDTTTTKQQVKEFQKTELLGLVPSISAFGFDESKTAVAKLLTGEPYWPEHIISQLPDVVEYKKPLHVYFRNDWKNYVKTLGLNWDKDDWDKDVAWESRLCSTWDELGEVLKEEPHQLVFHIHMVTNAGVTIHEFISMIETLLKLVCPHKTIPIAVGIDIDTPMNTIRELQKSNIHGIVPSALDFGITETMHGADALFNRIPYWPKHILDQLPGAPKKIIKNTITLTPRQSQIATLIGDRGLSNKKIAQSLNITESTVKIHVSAILKAYGVRTRTQLAVVANK